MTCSKPIAHTSGTEQRPGEFLRGVLVYGMKHETAVQDCCVFDIKNHKDHRGSFTELYRESDESCLSAQQINCSVSHLGILRGIHQAPYWKLVTCVQGKILDVCYDLREDSPTYLKHVVVELTYDRQIYIPPGCGHAFQALTDAVVVYSQGGVYDPEHEKSWHHGSFYVPWPLYEVVSQKDFDAPLHPRHHIEAPAIIR